ncbi:merozoite surface protein 5 [Plasmodium vivax]|uniref:Merozoite surface protein 5 n=1 Tax=Plasmodium vivax (strain Salvador I) TaxID=126793 RepID=A5KBL6_PLAVS|nr:merozoite surface protein 5 [Plasmodium vivax]EDL43266.1 merozoite surface protein 5 [Plasmodium vivax]|eukprot:XP_001612993.1 merozoite surface protein 5 [Plasmodium vivax Sal-1]
MAIARVVLAIHLFLLCSYHSGRPLEVSLWGQGNAHLGTQTSRLLRESGRNGQANRVNQADQADQVASPPISGKERRRGIGMTSNLQLLSGEDEKDSTSEEAPNLEGKDNADAGKDGEKEPSEKQSGDVDPTVTDAERAKDENASVSEEEQMKTLDSGEDHTDDGNADGGQGGGDGNDENQKGDGKEKEGGEEKKEDGKDDHEKGEKGSEGESGEKDEAAPKGDAAEKDKKLESKTADAKVSEHKADDANPGGNKDSPEGESPKEGNPDDPSQKNPEAAGDDDSRLHLDNLDDKVPHYSALRNNRVEKGVTDTMVLNDIIGENAKSCSVDNGGCADDQICIRIDNIGIKCICKEGHLFGDKCILTKSSALGSFFSAGLFALLALLWLC